MLENDGEPSPFICAMPSVFEKLVMSCIECVKRISCFTF